jgi:TPR repeat protein
MKLSPALLSLLITILVAIQGCSTGRIDAAASKTSPAAKSSPARSGALEDARNGDVAAMTVVGNMYLNGDTIPKDEHEAYLWINKAANAGSADGQYYLGRLYADGLGADRDYGRAAYWYQQAANKDIAAAKNDLGELYYYGLGVSRDTAVAYGLFMAAAEQGYANAQFRLSLFGPKALAHEGQPLYWLIQSATNGHPVAQSNLGVSYLTGDGVPQDSKTAAKWFEKSASQGDAYGQFNLARLFATGEGVQKNPECAALFYRKSAEQGLSVAQFSLGNLYATGSGTKKDLVIARSLIALSRSGNLGVNNITTAASMIRDIDKELTSEQKAESDKITKTWKPGTPFPLRSQTWTPAASNG